MNVLATSLAILTLLPASVLSAQTAGATAGRRADATPPPHEAQPILAGTRCADSLRDQATATRCLQASSTPAMGRLLPYPGEDNVFTAPSYVGGGTQNTASGLLSFIGGGTENTTTSSHTTVAGGDRNTASGPWSTIAGGRQNTAAGYGSSIGGGTRNEASGSRSWIGGGYYNITSGSRSSVGGGLYNRTAGRYATIGGGYFNSAGGNYATVGGGRINYATGYRSTIGGGYRNNAVGYLSTVAGGARNQADGTYAAVGGGDSNHAVASSATVPGGQGNRADGAYSFAAGRTAHAIHTGAFVWGDSLPNVGTSSANDEFNVYASGGVRMFTNSSATTGVLLAPGGGSWSSVSDRDSKENLEQVDRQAALAEVVAMPISTWNYRAQDDSVRHMGPMAQDFHAAFGLGVSDKLIDTIDADGVALAAIQGLNEKLEAENAELRAAQEALESELSALEEQVAELVATAQR